MTSKLPYAYQKLSVTLESKFYPRREITTSEFKETIGQSLKMNRKEWVQLARDLKELGIITYPKTNGLKSIELLWPKK